jgi:3alpha(or 20beta)-hydroxysteroid dehydrogenase
VDTGFSWTNEGESEVLTQRPGLMNDRVVVITGASSGLGATEAQAFHAEGASIVLADVVEGPGRALAEELGERVRFVTLDVRDAAGWGRVVDVAEEAFGTVDALVNTAAILQRGETAQVTHDSFTQTMDVNVWGCILGMQAVIPAMQRAGRGAIVNVASTGGIIGQVGAAAYVASKFALRGITKAAALELAPIIRVNSLHPGWIDSPMSRGSFTDEEYNARLRPLVPMGRAADTMEIAKVALFLASDLSSYMTGSEVIADGGRTTGSKPVTVH